MDSEAREEERPQFASSAEEKKHAALWRLGVQRLIRMSDRVRTRMYVGAPAAWEGPMARYKSKWGAAIGC